MKPYYDYLEEQGYMSSGQYLYENEFEILNILQNGQSKSSYIIYTDNRNAAGMCYDIYDIPGFYIMESVPQWKSSFQKRI